MIIFRSISAVYGALKLNTVNFAQLTKHNSMVTHTHADFGALVLQLLTEGDVKLLYSAFTQYVTKITVRRLSRDTACACIMALNYTSNTLVWDDGTVTEPNKSTLIIPGDEVLIADNYTAPVWKASGELVPTGAPILNAQIGCKTNPSYKYDRTISIWLDDALYTIRNAGLFFEVYEPDEPEWGIINSDFVPDYIQQEFKKQKMPA